jgi:hypothetical protein
MGKIRADCVQRPSPDRTTPPGYVPPDSSRRPVGKGVSFYSIAEEFGVHPWALVQYNFPTVGDRPTQRGAREMNWYLQEYLGCSEVTHDRKNYVFHDGLERPYIYVPITRHYFDEVVITADAPTWAWFGFGLKQTFAGPMVDTQVREEAHAMLVSWDHHEDMFAVSVKGVRHGVQIAPVAAGSAALTGYVATGLQVPRMLDNHEVSGLDFSLQLGPVSKALKGASATWKLGKVAKPLVKTAIGFAEWEKTREIFKQVIMNYDIDLHARTPKLHVIDLPFGIAIVEASVYYLKATARIEWTNLNVARVVKDPGEGVAVP